MILSLIFLQVGVSYYLSFQILALFILASLVLSAGGRIRNGLLDAVGYMAFAISFSMTAISSPLVISTNSSNIFLTALAILVYAAAIFHLPLVQVNRPEKLLVTLRSVCSAVILILVGILLISESNIIPFLTREAMVQQNSRLIDNFTDADALFENQAFLALMGENERIDLFYGEPSFLAIVLFTCLGCHVLTSSLLTRPSDVQSKLSNRGISAKVMNMAPYLATLGLLYIQSFSSIIYALVSIYFLFVRQQLVGKKRGISLFIALIFGAAFVVFSYDYFIYRLTMGESLSFDQRFGFFFELDLLDMIRGVSDVAMLPEVGIHNGLFYIVAISGVGGLIYLFRLIRTTYSLGKPMKVASFAVIIVLAILMQNGGVFSPNKVVLFCLVLLPLACSRTIINKANEPAMNARHING